MRLLARPHKFDGSFLIPKSIAALASCTTSVYVNLSKNSFFLPRTSFLRESECKGTTNFDTLQTFRGKFPPKHEIFRVY